MFASKLFWRIYGRMTIMALIPVLLLVVFYEQYLSSALNGELEMLLKDANAAISPSVEHMLADSDEVSLSALAESFRDNDNIRITVLNADRTIMADSRRGIAGNTALPFPLNYDRIDTDGYMMEIHRSSVSRSDYMFATWRLGTSANPLGYIQLSKSTDMVSNRLWIFRFSTVITVAIFLLLIALPLSGEIKDLRNLARKMTDTIKSMANGNYKQSVRTERDDEFGSLADSINDTCIKLQSDVQEMSVENEVNRRLLRSIPEGILAVDEAETIIHMNESAAKLLGVGSEESIGSPAYEIIRKPGILDALRVTLQSGESRSLEMRMFDAREEKVINVIVSPIAVNTHEIAGSVAVLRDITDKQKLVEFQRDLITYVSHDFKTPVTAIKGISETILNDPEMSQEHRDNFQQKVLNQANRLERMVNSMLELSNVEKNKKTSGAVPFDIRSVVRDTVETLMVTAQNNNLDLQFNTSADELIIKSDTMTIHKIVSNLLDNAIKYTPAGGKIVVNLKRHRDEAVIEVIDTGIGIAPQEHEKVFERFYRTDKSRSQNTEGTGLGLAIIDSLVRAHHGRITLSSSLGKGTRFQVYLPIATS